MEGDQDKVLDGSGWAVEGLLQDPRGALYHLLEIVVHGAGHIEHKGQGGGAVTGPHVLLDPGHCQDPVEADAQRQDQGTERNSLHSQDSEHKPTASVRRRKEKKKHATISNLTQNTNLHLCAGERKKKACNYFKLATKIKIKVL